MKIFQTILAVILVLATVAAASALPITIDEVQLDDITLNPSATNRVSIERGDEYEVEVRFTALQDLDDVEVEAFITGYEYGDVDRISDHTEVFSVDANVTKVKRLDLMFPNDIDQDEYKLRIYIADRDNYEEVASYNLKIDAERHELYIEDVILNPSGTVKAGSALLTSVRLENAGEKDEDDVRVEVSIPALGIGGTDYIDEIENGNDEEETEEIYMRIPRCTEAGSYDLNINVKYSKREISAARQIIVLADETCDMESKPDTQITLGAQKQEVLPGENANYPITLTNNGRASKSFTITPQATDWAEVTLSPSGTVIIGKGETKTVFVSVDVLEDTPAGMHTLTTTVTVDGTTSELSMTADVLEKQNSYVGVFEVTLAVLLILLIIIGIGIGLSKMRDRETKEYY